jgi:peptidoglycan-associated lipoprotein
MKKSLTWTLVLACSSLLLLDSCKSKNSNVWDDSSTVSQHKRAQERILWGNNSVQDEIAFNTIQESYEVDEDFIPLQDEDLKEQFTEIVFAQPKDSPGDYGSPLPGIEGFSLPMGALAQVFQTVYFNTDEYIVKKAEHLKYLANTAEYLKKNPKTYIFVEGHADERGPEAYNLALGTRRANYVRNFLIDKGVGQEQIYTISYGKEKLADFSNTPAGWMLNRRAQFKLYEKR